MDDIIKIENGEKPTPIFSLAEMTSRVDKLRSLLAEKNVDAVLFTSYHNINYELLPANRTMT